MGTEASKLVEEVKMPIMHTPKRRGRPRKNQGNTSVSESNDGGSGDHLENVQMDDDGGPSTIDQTQEEILNEPEEPRQIQQNIEENSAEVRIEPPRNVDDQVHPQHEIEELLRTLLNTSTNELKHELNQIDQRMDRLEEIYIRPLKAQTDNIEEVMDKNFREVFDELDAVHDRINRTEQILEKEKEERELQHAQLITKIAAERENNHRALEELKGKITNQENAQTPQGGPRENPLGKMPKLRIYGTERNPMQLLAEVERRLPNVSSEEKLSMIEKILEGSAKQWYEIKSPQIKDWETFKKTYKESYWNKYIQEKVYDQIENGKYNGEIMKADRTQYTYTLLGKAKYLDLPIGEEMLVSKISKHFGEQFYETANVKCTETADELIRLLQRFDSKGLWKEKKTQHYGNRRQAQIEEPPIKIEGGEDRKNSQNENKRPYSAKEAATNRGFQKQPRINDQKGNKGNWTQKRGERINAISREDEIEKSSSEGESDIDQSENEGGLED